MATDNRGNRFAAPGYLQARLFIVSGFRRMMLRLDEKLVAASAHAFARFPRNRFSVY
jgi:hypothetical protein